MFVIFSRNHNSYSASNYSYCNLLYLTIFLFTFSDVHSIYEQKLSFMYEFNIPCYYGSTSVYN